MFNFFKNQNQPLLFSESKNYSNFEYFWVKIQRKMSLEDLRAMIPVMGASDIAEWFGPVWHGVPYNVIAKIERFFDLSYTRFYDFTADWLLEFQGDLQVH